MAHRPVILAMVLAGGKGSRLMPLTADRAKPAVPFGGHYRLVDFVLSNLANAGYFRIAVLTQYKSHSLDRHISTAWRLSPSLGNYVTPVPAQQRLGPRWFLGSADALLQNLNLVGDERPDHLIVFGADHVYRMDPRQMVDQHVASGAACTVAAIRVPRDQCDQFGVIETAAGGQRITGFLEKPERAEGLPDDPGRVFASMGNYVFSAPALVDALRADAENEASTHDMGGSIVPLFVEKGEAHVYDFAANDVPGVSDQERGYWRDVGTIDAYYEASMDLCAVQPVFNLYNQEWPILTQMPQRPAAKFVFEEPGRTGAALDSIVSPGCIISGATVRHSVLSPDVEVDAGALVEGSVVMHGSEIGRGAVVRHAILDKHVVVPPGVTIGVDGERDRDRFRVSDEGVAVVRKGAVVEP